MTHKLPPNLKMVQVITLAHVHGVINCSGPGTVLGVLHPSLFIFLTMLAEGGVTLLLLPNNLDHGPQLSHWASNCGSAT